MPSWSSSNHGAVLSAAINRFCWITCRYLPPFFSHRSRFIWSKIESVTSVDEITHPAIKACLRFMRMTEERLEIHHDGDIPAMSGVGSSAAFTVTLLHALHALKGALVDKRTLALEAIHVDQNLVGEAVGCQDHISSSYGGLNLMTFGKAGFEVTPLAINPSTLIALQSRLMLFYTGRARLAQLIEQDKINRMSGNEASLRAAYDLVAQGVEALSCGDLDRFGQLLSESWELKKRLSPLVSNGHLDSLCRRAVRAGASGLKVTGAGGGGMLLVYARPESRLAVLEELSDLIHIPFRFDFLGSQIVHYQPESLESEKSFVEAAQMGL